MTEYETFVLTSRLTSVLYISNHSTSRCFLFPQGGIAFVAIKGAFKVYFKQQQYLRQAHRKILNFPEPEEAWVAESERP